VIRVLRAADRYETRQAGIVTWSCFASGSHYDPDNVAFGPLVAVDEHLIDPGAGFAEHAHRGVNLVTVVLSGTLRHEDGRRTVRLLRPGAVQVQHAGGGLRHAEMNGSDDEPVRIVQMALLSEDERSGSETTSLPLVIGAATLQDVRDRLDVGSGRRHFHVLSGHFRGGADFLVRPGDTLRADEPLRLEGAGRALMWTFEEPADPLALSAREC
jgi:redox-sensitive bicupin YhaK (pirin superfamily)